MSVALQNLNFIVSLTDKVNGPLAGIMKGLKGLDNLQARMGKGALNIGIGTGGLYAVSSTFDSLTSKAIAFEKAMANVSKATNQPLDAAMKGLGREVLKLSRTLPITQTELAGIMATGAKSNIPTDQLTQYTELVAKVSTAWETVADETSIDIAKLANIFQKPILEMGRFTDAINKLDDVSSSSAPEIVDVLKRVGGSAVAIKMTELQAAALGTTLLDLGDTSEKAGTGINALLERIGSPGLQSKTFKSTLDDIGWSVEKMEHAVKSSGAQTTIFALFDTINKFDEQKKRDILGGLFGSEYADNLSKLANNLSIYQSRVHTVTDEQAYLNSVNKEFGNRMEATAYKLQTLSNRMDELKIGFGGVLVDILDKTFPDLFKGLDTLNDKFNVFTEQHPLLTKVIGYSIVGLGALAAALSLAAIAWGILTIAALPAVMPLIAIGAAVAVLAWLINAGSKAMTNFFSKAAPIEWLLSKWEQLKGWWFSFKVWLGGLDPLGSLASAAATAVAWVSAKWESLKVWWNNFKSWLASLNPFAVLLSGIDTVINKIHGIASAFKFSIPSINLPNITPPAPAKGVAPSGAPRGDLLNKMSGKVGASSSSSTKNVTINVSQNGGSVSPAAIAHHLAMAG